MRILFNIFLFIYFSTAAHSAFIQSVAVTGTDDQFLISKINSRFNGVISSEQQVEAFLNQIRQNGVYQSITFQFDKKKRGSRLVVNIQYNPVITKIHVVGSPIPMRQLTMVMAHTSGDYLNFKYLKDDVAAINKQLVDWGYITASVKSISVSDAGTMTIMIESPTISEIVVMGLDTTPSWVIYRELLLSNGDQLNRRILDIDLESLSQLSNFSSVNGPTIEMVSSDNVRLAYQIRERKQNMLDIGLEELEDDKGVALFSKLKWYNRFIYTDFIELQFQLGYLNNVETRAYKFRYNQPWLFNSFPVSFDISFYKRFLSEVYQEDLTIYKTIRSGGAVSFMHQIKRQYLAIATTLRNETVVPQDDGDFSGYTTRSISFLLDQNKVDHFQYPTFGHRIALNYDIGGNLGLIDLGGISFHRFRLTNAYFYTLNQSTFAVQLFGGRYKKLGQESTFETERFSLGGANSLRGYNEFSFLGNYRLSFNFELRQRLSQNIAGVLFLDGGFINDEFNQLFDQLYRGYGFGVRLLESVIPLRLDFGFGNDELMVHFNVSQTF
ncbi:MAG: BamA/TamA family outer membrane protein [Candidatus Marinamargulisbacteria bacterium]